MAQTSGDRVKKIREERGFSLGGLGRRVVPPCEASTIQKLERGEIQMTDDWRRRLARALECSTIDLYPVDEPPDPGQILVEEVRGLPERDRRVVVEFSRAIKRTEKNHSSAA